VHTRTDFGVYLVASGLPQRNEDHAENMAKMAVSLVSVTNNNTGTAWCRYGQNAHWLAACARTCSKVCVCVPLYV
jgi:hypothetical protein